MKKTHAAVTGEGSAWTKYLHVVVGNSSFLYFLYFEWCQLLACIPGALGMVLRKWFWPRLFAACSPGAVFGYGVVVRHPCRMRIGEKVVISEYCILDGRHSEQEVSIEIGDETILSNNVMLSCKDGFIKLGDRVGVNAQTVIQSTNHNPVQVNDDCVIGQRCLIIAGGTYDVGPREELIRERSIKADGGVSIQNNVWLGANVTVLGGVVVGEGSVVGAGAVVTKSVPTFSVCMGVPARVARERQ